MSDQGVGIVIVSHSRPLGRAVADLASQMLPGPEIPPIEIAAGLDDTTLGTDASAVSAAIKKVGGCDGILVLVDLGSAILSAAMALDFLDPDIANKVKISTAPLVEGAVVAAVMASTGAELEVVAAEAEKALDPKVSQLSND
ncbi:PTS-dependent dihydroxyacetone kinase phosphotransferase subunit DhaM [Propionibacterium sp. NM47_B9-13]|jgi:PTS hybrid protein|uniref:phosphoenolpyruvate--glycerone phosphotransferase n=2 Tax=Cutibacterium modestum TaxID=2559073 RepID=A0AAD1KR72_9ACTN|nr:dihydroxyacetone kinase phosphoryl donor subunit DhaM [Cutibacterium modestum]TGY30018.1 PTS-dependent dihydroxyacetone kinase phosphotransferase subunit DhaM [Propionibacterium sp. NM47_B9-13]AOH45966.1 dihydroxyacetone kinase [Cutibacterium modestum]EFS73898.1 dihydroxyacetone kinase, phosphotransfer subunit [Cutibacterium modestum HL037PA2]EFS91452.1 dihydroxyacetone kinase, phosphotransfer subunit [Cutibacterium modestum HL044PA1]EFT15480.1 dihydroxyacetone kinase, phosphotransfer subun